MLKKILLASSILVATSTIAAANTAPYVGASIGVIANTSDSAAYGKNGNTSLTSMANYRGVPFNVFAGYGGVINENFYLAGEFTGTLGTADISDNNRVKTSYAYGGSIIPGLMLSDHTLAFLRAGVVRSHFSNADKSKTGGEAGLGMQTTLTQNVDIRAEYDFIGYSSFHNSMGRVDSPRTDAFNLGLVYKFD